MSLVVWSCPCGSFEVQLNPAHGDRMHFHCGRCGGCVGPVPTSAEVAEKR